MLTLRKVGIPSFEFEGSGMGSAYTDTKIQKIDSEFLDQIILNFHTRLEVYIVNWEYVLLVI